MEITRHFTATVLIVYREGQGYRDGQGDRAPQREPRVLLHRHKKRNALVPIGGHLERDELPQDAALREAREEAGLAVTLYDPAPVDFHDARGLVNPLHTLLIDMNPYHQHVDLIFYAWADTDRLAPAAGESPALHWYSRREVMETAMPDNVRILALEALDLLGGKE